MSLIRQASQSDVENEKDSGADKGYKRFFKWNGAIRWMFSKASLAGCDENQLQQVPRNRKESVRSTGAQRHLSSNLERKTKDMDRRVRERVKSRTCRLRGWPEGETVIRNKVYWRRRY